MNDRFVELTLGPSPVLINLDSVAYFNSFGNGTMVHFNNHSTQVRVDESLDEVKKKLAHRPNDVSGLREAMMAARFTSSEIEEMESFIADRDQRGSSGRNNPIYNDVAVSVGDYVLWPDSPTTRSPWRVLATSDLDGVKLYTLADASGRTATVTKPVMLAASR